MQATEGKLQKEGKSVGGASFKLDFDLWFMQNML